MSACIYCIKNNANGHCYIGQTINYVRRKTKHFSTLRNNKHYNTHLQRAFNKYGEDSFVMYVIEEVDDITKLEERETYWIEQLGYYNRALGSKGFTEETLEKMRQSHLGKASPTRLLDNEEEVFYILAIDTFCDGAVRAIATLANGRFARTTPKMIVQRKTYPEITKKFDAFSFQEKLYWLQRGIDFYNYNFWKSTNAICPKKNAYYNFVIRNYSLRPIELAQIFHMTENGIYKVSRELRRGQREINTTFTDEEIKQILRIVIDEQYRAKLDL